MISMFERGGAIRVILCTTKLSDMSDEFAPPPLPATAMAGIPSSPIATPISGLADAISAVLRKPQRVVHHFQHRAGPGLSLLLAAVAIACALTYGLVVGSFSGGTQLWAAPLKVTCGLLLSALICLPSLYVFSCLAGSEVKWTEMCGLVAGLLALMTLLLIGFAPVAWLFSQSTDSVIAMGFLHLFFWMVATWFGLRFLNVSFGILGDRSGGLKVWSAIFVLVMLQMMTSVRPIVGTSTSLLPIEKRFFVSHWFLELQGSVGGSRAAAGQERER